MGAGWTGFLTNLAWMTWDIHIKYMLWFVFGKDPVSVLSEYCIAEKLIINSVWKNWFVTATSVLWLLGNPVEDSWWSQADLVYCAQIGLSVYLLMLPLIP